MYRFNTTDNNLSDLVALGVDIRDDDNTLNKSYGSAVSAASSSAASASSSKAVLAALRALQDKIRRLEVERTQAIDETTQLRHQLKNQEIESEHIKQRETLNSQKSLQESRSAYDRLLGDKAELEVRVSKLEERNRLGQQTSDELQSKIKLLEDEKQNGLIKVKNLENHQLQLESQIQHCQSKEKDLANTMVWETKRHDDEMTSLTKKLKSLQDELNLALHEKQLSNSKQVELDQLVTQLLSVNEALVSQLSGKSTSSKPISLPSSSKSKKKQQSIKGLVPRVAGVTTVALEAARTVKYDERRQSQLIPVRTDDLEHLKNLHKMYANIASNVTNDKSKKKKVSDDYKQSKTKKPLTRLGKKKSELKSKGSSSSSSSVTTTKTNGIPSTTLNHKVRIPTPSASFDYLMQDDSDDNDDDDDDDYEEEEDIHHHHHHHNRPISAPASSHYSTRSTKPTTPANDELQEIISSLEDEFDSLNNQYRRLLSSVQTTSSDLESSQAEELVSVIQKLHKKGEILRSLKSPKK